MTTEEKIEKISAAPSCPYDRAELIERVASGRILSAGQSRWLSSIGIDDERIDSALDVQSPDARRIEFEALAARYALSNQTIALMLNRSGATICRYRRGALEIPPALLSSLRRIVAAIDAAK